MRRPHAKLNTSVRKRWASRRTVEHVDACCAPGQQPACALTADRGLVSKAAASPAMGQASSSGHGSNGDVDGVYEGIITVSAAAGGTQQAAGAVEVQQLALDLRRIRMVRGRLLPFSARARTPCGRALPRGQGGCCEGVWAGWLACAPPAGGRAGRLRLWERRRPHPQ